MQQTKIENNNIEKLPTNPNSNYVKSININIP